MDEQQKARLDEAHRVAHEAHGIASGIHNDLYEVPKGSDKDERSFMSWSRTVIAGYRRATWATRAIIWGLPTLTMMVVSWGKLTGLMGWGP